MMQKFICLQVVTEAQDIKETLVALLSEIGFYAFEEREGELLAFIDKENDKPAETQNILRQFNINNYSIAEIENKNWNQQWESSFEPVIIGNFAAIRAGFHQPIHSVKHQIIITPKMSFGTGHHATTYLMMKQMKEQGFTGKTVIDFGTGTGVLSILSEKLGAKKILAIDNDEWSIANTKENIETNNCRKIRVLHANCFTADEKADIILANINLNVITANLGHIEKACNKGSFVLFSGLLTSDKETIQIHLKKHNFNVRSITERNGWICLLTIYAIS